MTEIEHIQSLTSAPWVMWVMLFMLLLFAVANIRQPHLMRTAWNIAFKRADRVYNDAAVMGISSIELHLFCILSVAMSFAIAMDTGGSFLFTHYLLVAACVLVWYLLRWGIRMGIGWLGKLKRYGFPAGFMMSLNLCLTAVLFLLNLGAIWTANWIGWRIGMAAIALLWLTMIGIKHYQCFVYNWKTFLGLTLYWAVVEVGSLVGLYFLIRVL